MKVTAILLFALIALSYGDSPDTPGHVGAPGVMQAGAGTFPAPSEATPHGDNDSGNEASPNGKTTVPPPTATPGTSPKPFIDF
ncbi:hypothetical protein HDE_06900 [Halotydeus destructor]|nr:hypothetical protein HDE_09028 [Halotydeus destructor]KAI1292636.1 hypothetical protein HDE_06900 [Halotydeus destructor]